MRKRWWRDALLSALLTGGVMGYWGHYQYQKGFKLGVDTALCAWRVGLATGGAVIPRSLSECREQDTTHTGSRADG